MQTKILKTPGERDPQLPPAALYNVGPLTTPTNLIRTASGTSDSRHALSILRGKTFRIGEREKWSFGNCKKQPISVLLGASLPNRCYTQQPRFLLLLAVVMSRCCPYFTNDGKFFLRQTSNEFLLLDW